MKDPYLDTDIEAAHKIFRTAVSSHSPDPIIVSTVPRLPRRAEQVILLIFPKNNREHLLGDLAEEYIEIAVKHGDRFANIWYWKQVVASAWPFLKKALRWGLLVSSWEWIRRFI